VHAKTAREVSIQPAKCLVGIISDTHGLLRPEAIVALHGSDLIIHAGDIGKESVLNTLRQIAPVFAVRGNNDHGDWAEKIPASGYVKAGGLSFYVLHDLNELDQPLNAKTCAAVIAGHSHRALVREREGVLFINPGSAGPRRFHLPVTVARLQIRDSELTAKIIDLAPAEAITRPRPGRRNKKKAPGS
jgi:putative phosphoesterase